jgi:nitrile hydratase subunit beta
MNGPHDIGGGQCFGPVTPEANEPVFHAEWEKRAFGITVAMGATGAWSLDHSRYARERMAPAAYLAAPYYAVWLDGLVRLLKEAGLASEEEIAAGRALAPPSRLRQVPDATAMAEILRTGTPTERKTARPARFRPGDQVRARVMHPVGHTRLPRYVRGRVGRIEAVRGFHVFPDARAGGRGEEPHWLYSVGFAAEELWGPQGRPGDRIHLDLWEPYFEPAGG